MRLVLDRPQLHAGVIHQSGLRDRGIQVVGDADGQRPLDARLDLAQRHFAAVVIALGGVDGPGGVIARETEARYSRP